MMLKRFVPLCFVALLCALPLTPVARSAGVTSATSDVQAYVADGSPTDVRLLTAADREALKAAERVSSPELQDMRAGNLLVAVLLIVLIIVLLT